jgi:rRNA maturation RNase YbeY
MIERWVQASLLGPAELAIRFVDAAEGQTLNRDYRHKDYATNVLTFAYNEGAESPTTSRPRPTSSCAPTCCSARRGAEEDGRGTRGAPGGARRAARAGLRP